MSSSINIINPKTIGVSVNSQFLGETLRLRRIVEVSITGFLLDLTAEEGAGSILHKIEEVSYEYLKDWGSVNIDGIDLGAGKLTSLSFSSGNDVRVKEYSASFEFYQSGDLSNLVPTGDLGDLSFINTSSVSESFSTTKREDGVLEVSHAVTVAVETVAGDNGFEGAKSLAQAMIGFGDFEDYADLLFLVNESSGDCANVYYSESYDPVNNEASIEKKWEVDPDSDLPYSVSKKNLFNFDGGIVVVSESAEYKTKAGVLSCFDEMFDGMISDIGGSFTRCNSIYNEYNNKNGLNLGGKSLLDHYFSRQISSSPQEGACSYSIEYSNDKLYNESCFWSRTLSFSVNEDGTKSAAESGEVIGSGHLGGKLKQETANSFFDSKVSEINSSISSFFNSMDGGGGYGSENKNTSCFVFRLNSKSVTRNNRLGKVSYNFSYSSSPDNVDDPKFKKIKVSCSDQAGQRIALNTNFMIPKFKEIKYISAGGNKIPDELSASVELVGKEKDLSFDEYKSRADSEIDNSCVGDYVIDASYSFSPSQNSFTASSSSINI